MNKCASVALLALVLQACTPEVGRPAIELSKSTRIELCTLLIEWPELEREITKELVARGIVCSWWEVKNVLEQRQLAKIENDPWLVAYFTAQQQRFQPSFALSRLKGKYDPKCFISYGRAGVLPSCPQKDDAEAEKIKLL